MKAKLSQYRQSPQKVRLVTDHIKGKSVPEAQVELKHLTKRATKAVKKLLDSAVANAENNDGKKAEDLFVKNAYVDQGPTYKRFRPRARGRSTEIKKRTSHITIELDELDNK